MTAPAHLRHRGAPLPEVQAETEAEIRARLGWVDPPNPLPDDAPQAWQDLWISTRRCHPNAPKTFLHAYQAGVNPEELVNILLVSPKDHYWLMPRMAFGGTWKKPERVFGPTGEVAL